MGSMKRHPMPKPHRPPSRSSIFLEWLFLMVIIVMIAILLSRLWLRATGQEEQPSVLPFLSSQERTITPTPFDMAASSATAGSRLRNSELLPQETRFASSEASLSTPVVISDSQPSALGGELIGQPAPDFTLPTLDGGEITLSDLRGQPVLINFWASWCAPCWVETPLLVDAYHRYADEGLVVLGVNLTEQDTLEEARAFVSEFDVSYPILLDDGPEVSHNLYNLIGLPMSVFVDRRGIVKRVIVGAIMDTEIDRYIAEIMGEDDQALWKTQLTLLNR